MENLPNIPTVAHVIQLALTPVFLLSGVGSILSVLTGRLARVIDRYRALTDAGDTPLRQADAEELANLTRRVGLIHAAISLCTICALLVCIAIVALFLGAELQLSFSRPISLLFITAILALTCGLLCFLREIALAARAVSGFRES